MNLKTTIVLLVLFVAGAGGWFVLQSRIPASSSSKSLEFLDKQLTPASLTKIEITRKGQPSLVLEKRDGEWTLPGNWPVRGPEVRDLVTTLTSLHSRFAPIEVDKNTNFARFGLDDNALSIKLTVDGKTTSLLLGEETADENRFTRASYVRIDGQNEVIRLGPGLIAALDRPVESYQQRRLFPVVRVAKDADSAEKVEEVSADFVRVVGPEGTIAISKHGDKWLIDEPVKDRVDPEKIRSLLTGFTDLWADRFVNDKAKTPEETGLAKPEFTLAVKRPGGGETTLLIGKVSSSKERVITKPAPPPTSPFMPPPKPSVTIVKEEYRYAKLPDNDQIFEIKTDSLKSISVPLKEIRDPRVARFKADDVESVVIDAGGKSVTLVKTDDKWRLKEQDVGAESEPIRELIDKLAGLEAKGDDIRDGADPKDVGLASPLATVTLVLKATKEKKDDTTKVVYRLGENSKDKGKVFVQLTDWPRVNVAGDDLAKLVLRDALAYRQRRLLDVGATDLAKIQITHGADDFAFERKDGAWSQIAPSSATIEQNKVEKLARDLARIETSEFVVDVAKNDDLDKKFGLVKPAITARFDLADKKGSHTLRVGNPRPEKDDFYARLDSGPIFAVKKDLVEELERGPLTYRPTQAWQVVADDIVELKIQKDGQAYTLTRDDKTWKIAGPFTALARPEYATAIADELAQLKSEKFVAEAKDLAKFGLDKPTLRFEILARPKPGEDKNDKEPKKDKAKDIVSILEIGKLDDSGKSRFARVGGGDAIFLVSEKSLSILDRGALDLLDRVLVDLDPASVNQIRFQGPATFTLEKAKDGWQVVGSPAPTFRAEADVVKSVVEPVADLLAEGIVAYGPKIDWAKYGLDKPAATIIVSAQNADKKAVEHTLHLGKDAGSGKRFARVDQQQQVAVLDAAATASLSRTHLDFVNPRVLKFAFDAVTRIDRDGKPGPLELVKRDDAWQITKPAKQPADILTVDDIIEKTFQLKVPRVAAFPAKDLKPFGLDSPAATVVVHLGDDKSHTLKIGDATGPKKDERFAIIDDGDQVVVLPAALSKHLMAPALYFADRNIASFGSADRIDLSRGDRKAAFVKTGSAWKMIDPVKAEAEETLTDFVQSLYRLRADEIVAGKDADLKEFGLESPTATWTIKSGDTVPLDLIIGDAEKTTEKESQPRRYARLASGDKVFLLSPKMAAAALAEYRNRKPWPAIDAAQIEQVKASGEIGDFTLVKRGAAWSLKDRPEAKANEKAVTDLLDALASLKAERYVADTKGNAKLFGLEPPTSMIEIATPTGSRTLSLGRIEGDSKRRYAAVSGSDAVFVIGEAEAVRLTRSRSEYID